MINYKNIEIEGVFTEGFELSVSPDMNIKISPGTFTHIKSSGTDTYNFSEFSFDVEPDDIFSVQYDVYLLSEKNADDVNVEIHRTELGEGTIAFYTGDAELLYTLLSFVVPSKSTSLDDISISVRNIVRKEKETQNETNS